ncbi:hypothetical protein CDCA_CDCA03G1066 [Cyanidium caldarium]|uniref:Haem-binding uptake Tiki superfamily ChaN domain-containing protein n=1 Tax=Cyanidium caldarium TaxID=2771 RepID=A0AAV9IS88_CYACA|nr:hypothetical protein CDCA_CDCA03G1066 [Cyanidium caldarium]
MTTGFVSSWIGVPHHVRSVRRHGDASAKTPLYMVWERCSRRECLRYLSTGLLAGCLAPAAAPAWPLFSGLRHTPAFDQLYRLQWEAPDGPESVRVSAVNEAECYDDLVQQADVVLLGEHHNSSLDHDIESRVIAGMSLHIPGEGIRRQAADGRGPLLVGLEMVEEEHQQVLDDFVAGKMSEEELYERTDWESNWVWPYERYLNLLRTCKSLGIRMIALNMDARHTRQVLSRGMQGILEDRTLRRQYFGDDKRQAVRFAQYAMLPEFRLYTSEVIHQHYLFHKRMQLLAPETDFEKFLAARMMRDQVLADRIRQHLREGAATGLQRKMVVCCGADHVKFAMGVRARLEWDTPTPQHPAVSGEALAAAESTAAQVAATSETAVRVRSIMLNPTTFDTGVRSADGTVEHRRRAKPRERMRLRLAMLDRDAPYVPLETLHRVVGPEVLPDVAQVAGTEGEPVSMGDAAQRSRPLLLSDYVWVAASKASTIFL